VAADLRPLTDADPAALAALLDARHGRHRAAEPLLAPADAATEIADLLGRERLSGAVAVDGGEVVGYLAGELRENRIWGTHAWVARGAHAAAGPEVMRDLYAAAAPGWIEAGARLHLALVPATGDQMDPWYRLGFGQMQVEGIRESGAPPRQPLPDGLTVRIAVRDDLAAVGEAHGMLVWEHQQGAATFTGLEAPDREAVVADWLETFDEQAETLFVAERGGELLGSTLYGSAPHAIGIPQDAVRLEFAAVLPQARGQGVGRALADASFAWARKAGYGTIVVDWRAPNLLASRFWPARGFRPAFHRMYRMTGIG
jgi:ribosomal protein S18 acetylase RimI-like enzyme